MKFSYLFALAIPFLACCTSGTPEGPKTDDRRLSGNNIVIDHIEGLPADVTFDRVRAEISGVDWQVIATVEAVYEGGELLLPLPASIEEEKLQKAVREGKNDYTGYWAAKTDNPEAKVAALKDIMAWDGDQRVGRIYLSDWAPGESAEGKLFVYYHYASSPYTLSGEEGTYVYEASFGAGWNAYVNKNLSSNSGSRTVLCTTSPQPGAKLIWRFDKF